MISMVVVNSARHAPSTIALCLEIIIIDRTAVAALLFSFHTIVHRPSSSCLIVYCAGLGWARRAEVDSCRSVPSPLLQDRSAVILSIDRSISCL